MRKFYFCVCVCTTSAGVTVDSCAFRGTFGGCLCKCMYVCLYICALIKFCTYFAVFVQATYKCSCAHAHGSKTYTSHTAFPAVMALYAHATNMHA
jgi:hypothetical protein